ncbi:MAG: MBL fold metallo-hydrolase [Erysipelotrichaceae bacterium]|nr:MBL fold metallo-hydrolase [Erysipelotrichaceae bacterium]MBQ7888869.1 MBL fold metallo-hydrolase [Erysipelotrichaceae bacterium]MBQ7890463.1 MBL fold metallo-hydrolase [Erysipelotrichaceae bacterium]
MRYIGLCSGSKGNCWILQTRETTLMLDCGFTKKYLFEKMKECGIDLSDLDALLITHAHSDHIQQLRVFSHLPIYSVCELDVGIRLEPYQTFQIQDIQITPLAASHDAQGCCGYLFESEGEKLAYLTDTGYVSKLNIQMMQNLDYYIIESNHDVEMLMKTNRPFATKSRIYSDQGHLCNEDCGRALSLMIGENTKEITLAHLSEEANTPVRALSVVSGCLKDYKGILQAAAQKECIKGGSR